MKFLKTIIFLTGIALGVANTSNALAEPEPLNIENSNQGLQTKEEIVQALLHMITLKKQDLSQALWEQTFKLKFKEREMTYGEKTALAEGAGYQLYSTSLDYVHVSFIWASRDDLRQATASSSNKCILMSALADEVERRGWKLVSNSNYPADWNKNYSFSRADKSDINMHGFDPSGCMTDFGFYVR